LSVIVFGRFPSINYVSHIFDKNFLLLLILLKTEPPIDFFSQNPVQFGRQAKRGDPQIVDFSLLAPYT
jgi:hypothetical protein